MSKTDAASIEAGDVTVNVEWTEENEDVRYALLDAAPFDATVSVWGDEVYFDTPIDATPKETATEVEVGTVAYWHEGNALCVFWGPTPASVNDEPRAAGPVAPVGYVEDAGRLSSVKPGETARFVTDG